MWKKHMCKTFLLDHYSKCAFDNLLHFDKNKSLEKQRFYAVSKAFQAGDERIELPPKVLRPLSYHLTNPLYVFVGTRYLYHTSRGFVNQKS